MKFRSKEDGDKDLFKSNRDLLRIFEYRGNLLLQKSGMALSMKMASKEEGQTSIDIWNQTQVFHLNDLAKAYGEIFIVNQFYEFFNSKMYKDQSNYGNDSAECMDLLFKLYCYNKINQDLGTFRENDFLTSEDGARIRELLCETCSKLKRHVVSLVDTFAPSEPLMDSMIARGEGDLYNSILSKVYTAKGVFEIS